MKKPLTISILVLAASSSFATDEYITNIKYVTVHPFTDNNLYQQVAIGYIDAQNQEQERQMYYCEYHAGDPEKSVCIGNYDVFKTYLSIMLMAKSTNQTIWVGDKPNTWPLIIGQVSLGGE